MIRLELCKLGHKITKKLLPKPILDVFHLNSSAKKHRYPTHNKQLQIFKNTHQPTLTTVLCVEAFENL